jgi:hypothetical protein
VIGPAAQPGAKRLEQMMAANMERRFHKEWFVPSG